MNQQGNVPVFKIVLVVLAVLAALIAIPVALTYVFAWVVHDPDKEDWYEAETSMYEITMAIRSHQLEHDGLLPQRLRDLEGSGNAYPAGVPNDPFSGGSFIYTVEGQHFELVCLGKDRKRGGEGVPDADIVFNETGQVQPSSD